MASAIKRTADARGRYRYVASANLANHPVADWVHDPDLSAVEGVDQKLWIVDGETVRQMTPAEQASARAKATFKIYDYVIPGTYDPEKLPHDVDFIRGLEVRLARKLTFVKGELIKKEYYEQWSMDPVTGEISYSVPVLVEDFVYTRDPATNLVLYRVQTIKWHRGDGTLDEASIKTLQKPYTTTEAIAEGQRRRRNNVDNISASSLKFLIATGWQSKTTEELVQEGRVFLETHKLQIDSYVEGGGDLLHTHFTAATEGWLDNDITALTGVQGLTIRGYMLDQIS